MAEWKFVRLGEVATLTRGVSYNGSGLNRPGPLLIGMGQVDPADGLDLTDVRTYGGRVKPDHFISDQDVAVVMTDLTQDGGLLGSPAIRPKEAADELVVSHHLQRIRCGSMLDPLFASYLFRGPHWKSFVHGMATGTTVRAVSPEDAGRFEFLLPPLTTQVEIAGILAALDEKIALNRKQSLTITSIIPLIFSTHVKSYELVPLLEVGKITKGVSYRSSDLQQSETAMMTLKSIDRNGGYKSDGLKPFVGRYKADQVLVPGDMVVAQTDLTQNADVVGRVVLAPRQSQFSKLVASLDLVIVRPLSSEDHWYLYAALIQEQFRQHCRSWTSGTTVLHLSSDAIPRYKIPWADSTTRSKVGSEVESMVRLLQSRAEESCNLRAMRDAVLPHLLSGQIRSRDADPIVSNTV